MTKQRKLCLGIDTASDVTSVALIDANGSCASARLSTPRGQGEALMGMIQDVLGQMKKSPKDLTHIAVTIGPGSFTGVRIGLATARALGLALKLPVFGVDNFLASAYATNKKVKVVLDSKRDDYFVQDFDTAGKALTKPSIKSTTELKALLPFLACGSGATKLAQEIGCKVVSAPQDLAIATAQIVLNYPKKATEPHPLYLRDADVTI